MRPGLAVTLYPRGRKVLVVGTDAVVEDRKDRPVAADAHMMHIPSAETDPEQLDDVAAVFAHTGDSEINAAIAGVARDHGALGYAHDQPRYPVASALRIDGRVTVEYGANDDSD